MTRQDWIELFEEIVGRKPNPVELKLGEASDFDFKKIAEIVAISSENQISSQQFKTISAVKPSIWKKSEMWYRNLPFKKRYGLYGLVFLVLAGAGLGIVATNSGPDKLIQELNQAVTSHNYDKVARLLSTDEELWSREDVRYYLEYLEDEKIDWTESLGNLASSSEEDKIYYDEAGNRLFGLEESGRTLGLFPEYRLAAYPIEVKLESNLSELSIDGRVIPKGEVVSLGFQKLGTKPHIMKAKTDAGELESEFRFPFKQARDNQLDMDLKTQSLTLQARIQSDIAGLEDTKLQVNGKSVGGGLSPKLTVVEGQELEVYATFNYSGNSYATEKKKIHVQPKQTSVSVDLKLEQETSKKLAEQVRQKEEDRKAAEAEAARQAELARQEAERQAAEERRNAAYVSDVESALYRYRSAINAALNGNNSGLASIFTSPSNATYLKLVEDMVPDLRSQGLKRYDSGGDTITITRVDGDIIEATSTFTTSAYFRDSSKDYQMMVTRHYVFQRSGNMLYFQSIDL